METNWHIVYLSFEDLKLGRDYIGKHSTLNLQDGYLGSFKDKNFKPTDRIILEYCKTSEGAISAEIRWQRVFKVAEDPQFANKSYQTSVGFSPGDVKGEKNPFFGKKHSPETLSLLAAPKSPESKILMSEAAKKADKKEDRAKGGRNQPLHVKQANATKVASQRWRCKITGFVSSPGGLSLYQKSRGIDHTNKHNRERLS
jgi:hypothetical protein